MRIAKPITLIVIIGAVFMTGLNAGRAEQSIRLPGKAVMASIEHLLPGAKIEQIELERRIIQLYDITVLVDDRVFEVTLTEDGGVLHLEEEVSRSDLPDTVVHALKDLQRHGRLAEVERVEHHGQLQVVALDVPRIEYEVELRIDGRERLIRLDDHGEPVRRSGAGGPDDRDRQADDD